LGLERACTLDCDLVPGDLARVYIEGPIDLKRDALAGTHIGCPERSGSLPVIADVVAVGVVGSQGVVVLPDMLLRL